MKINKMWRKSTKNFSFYNNTKIKLHGIIVVETDVTKIITNL